MTYNDKVTCASGWIKFIGELLMSNSITYHREMLQQGERFNKSRYVPYMLGLEDREWHFVVWYYRGEMYKVTHFLTWPTECQGRFLGVIGHNLLFTSAFALLIWSIFHRFPKKLSVILFQSWTSAIALSNSTIIFVSTQNIVFSVT